MSIKYKHGIITKLPDDLNPNILIRKKIQKEYATKCPFCNSTDLYTSSIESEFMNLSGKWWKFWDINWCERLRCKCYKCNAEWKSPWYPQDLEVESTDDIDVDDFIEQLGVERKE